MLLLKCTNFKNLAFLKQLLSLQHLLLLFPAFSTFISVGFGLSGLPPAVRSAAPGRVGAQRGSVPGALVPRT